MTQYMGCSGRLTISRAAWGLGHCLFCNSDGYKRKLLVCKSYLVCKLGAALSATATPCCNILMQRIYVQMFIVFKRLFDNTKWSCTLSYGALSWINRWWQSTGTMRLLHQPSICRVAHLSSLKRIHWWKLRSIIATTSKVSSEERPLYYSEHKIKTQIGMRIEIKET